MLIRAGGACFIVAISSTSALFFLRVRAVYRNSTIITVIFGALWFMLLGLSFIFPIAADAEHIGTTKRCINTLIPRYSSTPIIFNAVFDTLVFLTISLRIMSFTVVGNTLLARMRSFLQGHGLPVISKGLLQDGQLYYLFVTISLDLISTFTYGSLRAA